MWKSEKMEEAMSDFGLFLIVTVIIEIFRDMEKYKKEINIIRDLTIENNLSYVSTFFIFSVHICIFGYNGNHSVHSCVWSFFSDIKHLHHYSCQQQQPLLFIAHILEAPPEDMFNESLLLRMASHSPPANDEWIFLAKSWRFLSFISTSAKETVGEIAAKC